MNYLTMLEDFRTSPVSEDIKALIIQRMCFVQKIQPWQSIKQSVRTGQSCAIYTHIYRERDHTKRFALTDCDGVVNIKISFVWFNFPLLFFFLLVTNFADPG